MKNKLMALLVLALFVISLVPMAIAEEASNVESDTELEVQSENSGDTNLGLGEKLRLRQSILERHTDANEDKADVLERRTDLVQLKVDFLARHRAQINELIKKCEDRGTETEKCKETFEHRLRNLASLPEDFKQRLAQFEERREKKEQDLEDLEHDENFSSHKRELRFKARIVNKARLEEARKNLIEAKFEFKEAKVKLEDARLRLEKAKKLGNACENPDSDECKTAKAELLSAAKEHFVAQADHIVKTLENIKSRVTGNEDLSDEEEASLLAAIDAEIAKINAIKAKINAAENKEQLLQAARELRDQWKKIKHQVKKYAAHVVSSRMAGIIVKSKHLETKLERVLARMTENGQNVSEVQPLVDEFHKEIELAKTSFKESQDLWAAVRADTGDNVETNTTVQDAQAKLKEARDHLNKARDLLWQIVKKMDKGALKDVEAEVELESEVSEENETSEGNTSTP